MIRHWRESATRVRRYAPTRRGRRLHAGVAPRFAWLRRARGVEGRTQRVEWRGRLALAIGLTWRNRAPLGFRPQRDNATAHAAHAVREVVRHEWAASPGARAGAPMSVPVVRGTATLEERGVAGQRSISTLRHERVVQRLLSSKAQLPVVVQPRTPDERRVPDVPLRAAAPAAPIGVAAARPSGSLGRPKPRIIRPLACQSLTLVHGAYTVHTAIRHAPGARVSGWRGVAAAQPSPTAIAATAAVPLDVVDRRGVMRAAAAIRAFAAQPHPLALQPTRASVADPVPVERIERTLRESLTLVAERTVQLELERTLRTGAPMNRRLRESIQSEMYDDIVLERERRGDR